MADKDSARTKENLVGHSAKKEWFVAQDAHKGALGWRQAASQEPRTARNREVEGKRKVELPCHVPSRALRAFIKENSTLWLRIAHHSCSTIPVGLGTRLLRFS